MSATPRFDDALAAALEWAGRHRAALGGAVHLVRDIHGRVRVVPAELPAASPELARELHEALGRFSPGPGSVFVDPSFVPPDELAHERTRLDDGIWLVERLVSEQGWRREPVASLEHPPRITFFGMKGGVGRSTTLVALAKRLAEKGLRVLVVDLDLESPGATSMLLSEAELPDFGVADWFVEDAVGQADDALLGAMVATSRVGDVLVAPALGSRSVPLLVGADGTTGEEEIELTPARSLRDGAYVAKLGRAYSSPRGEDLALRIEHMLEGLERVHRPDVVLLDSRAGMHDISAAAVPRLGGTVLLFAGATSWTWLAYRLLFSAWRREREVVLPFRDRLRVVAAQVPETGREAYLGRIREAAYDLFSSFLYDRAEGDALEGKAAYNFDVTTEDAPHDPLPVYWRRELVEWEPSALPDLSGASAEGLTAEQFEAAFGPFIKKVLALPYVAEVLPEEQAGGR